MSWSLLTTLILALGVALFAFWSRRHELRRMARSVREREEAQQAGSGQAMLQYPVVDLSRCLGCGTCVAVCPEDGVLEMVHGQATVVNGARCVGIAACERECPVGAISVTIANLATRTDVPVVDRNLEAVGQPGLFLAGEVTAHALVKTAIEHGAAIGAEVARRVAQRAPDETDGGEDGDGRKRRVLDLLVIGAGPAGLSCSLEATGHGLRHVVLEQEAELGGTVAKYPRRKLVLTQPVDLPLHGRMRRHTYSKEELIDLWREVAAEHRLPIRYGECFAGLEWNEDERHFVVHTQKHRYRARHVCLAIGRRGVPNKLGVPGEDLPKVAYSLLDAQSYQGRRVLVVGGGDSAVEAALALGEQPGNDVTLSYRKERLFRIRSKNADKLQRAVDEGRVRLLFQSEVAQITEGAVELRVRGQSGSTSTMRLSNDDVFVMVGGTPPVALLQNAGVSFDPSLRPPAEAPEEQGTGLYRALSIGFALSLLTLAFAFWHGDYYLLAPAERATHEKHFLLRPSTGIGLGLGIAAMVLIVCNLLYLLRRAPGVRWFKFGSLQQWMTSHVATGILALLCALLHGAMSPRDTPGGHAFWGLVVLLITGAIGRYFYAYVPRATNGRELEPAEVKAQLSRVSEGWDQVQQRFRQRARQRVESLIAARQWSGTFFGRLLALAGVQLGLRRVVKETVADGMAEGVPPEQILETVQLTRRAHRVALMAGHYEDVRALLASWRYLHRWVAALMVLLVVVHVVHAIAYGSWYESGRLQAPAAPLAPLGGELVPLGGEAQPSPLPGAQPGGGR